MSTQLPIAGLTSGQMQQAARERLEVGHGRAQAIYRAAMGEARFVPQDHGLGARACAHWNQHFSLTLPEVAREQREQTPRGELRKLALRLPGGLEYEAVLLPMGRGRHTLCVSSQVGCKMGCGFCQTGRMGLLAHLTSEQIVAQLLVARQRGWSFRNVVFMGMGEALDNPDNLIQALRIMTDGGGLALAQARITVCTVGHVEGLRKLAAADFRRLNLSLSLNAANDRLRSELMPVNRRTPLAQLQQALLEYRPRRNFSLGVNYCLMPDINDSRADAKAVAQFCAPLGRVLVNVIPYNPSEPALTRPPEDHEVDRFVGWLREAGLPVRRRITKGRTVMAACGQLGNPELRSLLRARAR